MERTWTVEIARGRTCGPASQRLHEDVEGIARLIRRTSCLFRRRWISGTRSTRANGSAVTRQRTE